mmetsp:Transcript_30523/g.91508  ORF Transcript_30523/g.91508 Transcript_30523/m.91508 type:complete len:137 (-) Transcript_30523:248-658(-)
MLPEIRAVVAAWRDQVDFGCVYIQEAHACDEWPIGKADKIPQATTLEMRLKMARRLAAETDLAMPLFVDGINNAFETAFASWPFRFWCLVDGKVSFKAMPREANYHVADLVAHLEALLPPHPRPGSPPQAPVRAKE